MKFKYIIFEDDRIGEYPVIFPCVIEHVEIANQIAGVKQGRAKIISAGFVEWEQFGYESHNIAFNCFGKSVSLKLEARKEDSQIIEKHYNFEL